MSAPLSSPKKTRPLAVARLPPQERAGAGLPQLPGDGAVFTSIVRRIIWGGPSGGSFVEPPQ